LGLWSLTKNVAATTTRLPADCQQSDAYGLVGRRRYRPVPAVNVAGAGRNRERLRETMQNMVSSGRARKA